VAAFCAASCKDFPSTLGFHARAKPMLLVAGAHMGLKSAFGHRLSPGPAPVNADETASLCDSRGTVKERVASGDAERLYHELKFCGVQGRGPSGSCLVRKFVVSMAGEEYDVRVRDQNWKSRFRQWGPHSAVRIF